jgi:hypothetical protein
MANTMHDLGVARQVRPEIPLEIEVCAAKA